MEEQNPTEKLSNTESSLPAAPVNPFTVTLGSLPDDRFSKGRIVKYFPQSKYGFVKDHRGKDVYFNLDEIRFVGAKGRDSLREGIFVGYDVAWTSKGLHISKLKIY